MPASARAARLPRGGRPVRRLGAAIAFVLAILPATGPSALAEPISVREKLKAAGRFNDLRVEFAEKAASEIEAARIDVETAHKVIETAVRKRAEGEDKADMERNAKLVMPALQIAMSASVIAAKLRAGGRFPKDEIAEILLAANEIKQAYGERDQSVKPLREAVDFAIQRLKSAQEREPAIERTKAEVEQLVAQARADGLLRSATSIPKDGPVVIPSTVPETRAALEAERKRSEVTPPGASAQADSACVTKIRGKFPNASTAYVDQTCACVAEKERLASTSPAAGAGVGASAMTDCGTQSLTALGRIGAPLREEMVSTCLSTPAPNGMNLEGDRLPAFCGCLYERTLQSARPQLVMWKELGIENPATAAMKAAVVACDPDKPTQVKSLPFAGVYFPIKRGCDQKDETEITSILTVTPTTVSGYEHTCTMKKIVEKGMSYRTVETCAGQGETWPAKVRYDVVDDKSIRLYGENEKSSSIYYKCKKGS